MSYGFIFGRVAYLSKVSAIPEATMRFLREQDIEVLIIEVAVYSECGVGLCSS